ncbi:MAG: methionyl-tRNA formyltransferase [Pseudomonadota bacterium]|nr:methionyl-tRNA formyltransferase [Pseudomonadota bacterium]
MSLRIVFAGTPQFAVPTLQALLASEHEICAVYTQPDRPAGRGRKLGCSPVKELALAAGIPIYQPHTLRDADAEAQLRALQPDLMVVAAYGLILPASVLAIPAYGCVNVHASILPKWRGAAPIQRAILAGDVETGVTIMQMNVGLDTGDMLRIERTPILAQDTAETVEMRLATLGATALLDTLEGMLTHNIKAVAQNDAEATHAAKIQKTDGLIDWQQSATTIDRQIRALIPRPIAYTTVAEHTLRIWQAEVIEADQDEEPGTILAVNKTGIDVATGHGVLRILTLQLAGGKTLQVSDFINAPHTWLAPKSKLC